MQQLNMLAKYSVFQRHIQGDHSTDTFSWQGISPFYLPDVSPII